MKDQSGVRQAAGDRFLEANVLEDGWPVKGERSESRSDAAHALRALHPLQG